MNKESVPTTIKLGYAPRPEFSTKILVPANIDIIKEFDRRLALHTDRRLEKAAVVGVEESVVLTESDWRAIRDALKVGTDPGSFVILHPSVWRALKAVRQKHKAKRRTRARMRSRGYVAHGRHK